MSLYYTLSFLILWQNIDLCSPGVKIWLWWLVIDHSLSSLLTADSPVSHQGTPRISQQDSDSAITNQIRVSSGSRIIIFNTNIDQQSKYTSTASYSSQHLNITKVQSLIIDSSHKLLPTIVESFSWHNSRHSRKRFYVALIISSP